MKITIASRGRAHLLNSAIELINHGHDVTFIASTPWHITEKYGLERKNYLCILPFTILFELLERRLRKKWTKNLLVKMIDLITSILMPKSDIFICQSPYFYRCMKVAKRRNEIVILDKGSSHILTFNEKKILYDKKGLDNKYIENLIKQHKIADYILVASKFAYNSFIKNGVEKEKLFLLNYGVSLKHFGPTSLIENPYDLLYIGQWHKRKGCELLTQYIEKNQNIRLLHIGSLVGAKIPTTKNFTHIDNVDETMLKTYYSYAKIFIMPTYEDGFGLTLLQAVACGLPIISTANSGAPDIIDTIGNDYWIKIIQENNTKDIEYAVNDLLSKYDKLKNPRKYAEDLNKISWLEYGEKYDKFLREKTTK